MTEKYPIVLLGFLTIMMSYSPAFGNSKVVMVKTAADSEAAGYESHRAMDGDPRTMWHTFWGRGETSHPHDIMFDLGKSRDISGFAYLP